MDSKCIYTPGLSCSNSQRLEVFENVKYTAVTLRASKLQVSKVGELRDFNPGFPRESLNVGKLTHAGGTGSNHGQVEL